MTKEQYLSELRTHLSALPSEEREALVKEYEALIEKRLQEGSTEASIFRGLGDPKAVAKSLTAHRQIRRATTESSFTTKLKLTLFALGTLIALAPLNFVLLVGPVLLIGLILFIGWIFVLCFGALTLTFLGALLFHQTFLPFAFFGHMLGVSFLLVILGFLAVATLMLWLATKSFLNALLRYLRWNADLLQRQLRHERT